MSDRLTPTRRMTAVDRRQQIIQAAIEVFAKSGFRGATTRQLAEKAGVSEAIIFRHFATKQDLYAAILDFKSEQWAQDEWLEELRALADNDDDDALFRTVSVRVLEAHRCDPDFQRLMVYAALEGHEFSRMLHSRRWPLHALLLDYIGKRQRAGALRSIDAELVVAALIAMPAHLGMITACFGFAALPIGEADIATSFSQMLLDGVRAVPQPKPSFVPTVVKNPRSHVPVR